jgi:hypothetical protein
VILLAIFTLGVSLIFWKESLITKWKIIEWMGPFKEGFEKLYHEILEKFWRLLP